MDAAPAPRRWLEVTTGLVLLLIHAILLAHSAWIDSDTMDEPGHVAAGLSYWHNGTFRLYQVNPPLSRLVQAVPVLPLDLDRSMLVDPKRYGDRLEAGAGSYLAFQNADRYREIIFRARLGTLAFSLLGGVLIWLWANLACGRPCGLLALALWTFDPSIQAQGHMVSPDLPAAVMTLAAALALRAYLLLPTWPRALLAGFILGLAELTKFTLLILYPLWLVIGIVFAFTSTDTQRPRFRHALVGFLFSLLVINAGYLFQETGKRLESYRFLSSKLGRFAPETLDTLGGPTNALGGTWLGALPVPLPAPYIEGIDLQARDFDTYAASRTAFYLRGEWAPGGWYHYYVYGLFVKSPLALWALLLLAGVLVYRSVNIRGVDKLLLVVIPVGVLVFVSLQTGMNKHIRYVLPALPFLLLLAAASGRVWLTTPIWPRWLVVVLLLWFVGAGLRAARDPLAYFNESVGGSAGGYRHLAGSNIDWGQSLYRLKDWLDAHPDFRPVSIAFFGHEHFPVLDVPWNPPPPGFHDGAATDAENQRQFGPHPGRFIVSVRVLQGDGFVLGAPGTGRQSYMYFQHFTAIDTIGDSMWVFDISLDEANRVRERLGLVALESP